MNHRETVLVFVTFVGVTVLGTSAAVCKKQTAEIPEAASDLLELDRDAVDGVFVLLPGPAVPEQIPETPSSKEMSPEVSQMRRNALSLLKAVPDKWVFEGKDRNDRKVNYQGHMPMGYGHRFFGEAFKEYRVDVPKLCRDVDGDMEKVPAAAIVVNKRKRMAHLFVLASVGKGWPTQSYTVAIGKETGSAKKIYADNITPEGLFWIGEMAKDPVDDYRKTLLADCKGPETSPRCKKKWDRGKIFRPRMATMDGPGPWDHVIAFHGTVQKLWKTVGTKASLGCFRMYNDKHTVRRLKRFFRKQCKLYDEEQCTDRSVFASKEQKRKCRHARRDCRRRHLKKDVNDHITNLFDEHLSKLPCGGFGTLVLVTP